MILITLTIMTLLIRVVKRIAQKFPEFGDTY